MEDNNLLEGFSEAGIVSKGKASGQDGQSQAQSEVEVDNEINEEKSDSSVNDTDVEAFDLVEGSDMDEELRRFRLIKEKNEERKAHTLHIMLSRIILR